MTQGPRRPSRWAAVSIIVATTGVLSGCGSSDPASAPHDHPAPAASSSSGAATASSQANDADVMFAQMMIPHHRQAVRMSETIIAKPGVDARVTALARQIQRAQQPEITTMTGWLTAWGQPVETEMGGMHHGDDGMLSEAELTALSTAGTEDGQRLFLDGMVGHHRGAITMAEAEIAAGTHPDAIALARDIVRTQRAEIATLQEIRTSL